MNDHRKYGVLSVFQGPSDQHEAKHPFDVRPGSKSEVIP